MKNILKKINKSNCHILSLFIGFCVLSFIAYQFNIALFLVLFLTPFIFLKSSLQIVFYVILWFFINNLILMQKFSTFFEISLSIVNVLIVSFINLFIYINISLIIYKNYEEKINTFLSKKVLQISVILVNIIVAFIIWDKFKIDISNYILIALFSSFIFMWLLLSSFPRNLCLYLNFIFSCIPFVTIISGYISLLFILHSLYLPKYFSITYMGSFYFLISFLIIPINSIFFYFYKKKIKTTYRIPKIIIIILCLSIGIILQNQNSTLFNF